jgi:hypothetical protein
MLILSWFVSFGCAFLGPERNPTLAVAWHNKVGALIRLAQTGKERDCLKVLGTIREKKDETTKVRAKYTRSRATIEEAIRKKHDMLPRAGMFAASVQRDIDSYLDTLETIKWQEARLAKLIDGRGEEERVFALMFRFVKACGDAKKTP